MRNHRWLAALVLGATLPVLACNDPTGSRMPDAQEPEQDDDNKPPDDDDTAFLLNLSVEPVLL